MTFSCVDSDRNSTVTRPVTSMIYSSVKLHPVFVRTPAVQPLGLTQVTDVTIVGLVNSRNDTCFLCLVSVLITLRWAWLASALGFTRLGLRVGRAGVATRARCMGGSRMGSSCCETQFRSYLR